MKNLKLIILLIVVFSLGIGIWYASDKIAKCSNGIFIGKKASGTDVIEFRGIPYARKPVGTLRWKPPVEAPKSNKINFVFKYNTMPLQNDLGQDYETFPKSEDCLRLNVWTKDLKTKNKPVMVYFHGGYYGWQGTAGSLYNGKYLVNEYNDIVVVSIDYRLNLMGFADFSEISGGENYKEAPYLGILDCIAGLKWVSQNIEAFGGNPDNVTIFGESAGAGTVSILMTLKEAKGLFNRAIAQSGTLNLTYTMNDYKKKGQTLAFAKAVGAKNMDDLLKLSDKQILKAMYKPLENAGIKNNNRIGNFNGMPLRGSGSIISENPYLDLRNGMSKDVDLMVGTNADEFRYWISEMRQNSLDENLDLYVKLAKAKAQLVDENIKKEYLSKIKTDNDKYSQKYNDIWINTELENDIFFRRPSIKMAEMHITANGKGKTYMYYFGKRCDINDWRGAAHAAELPYVFNNLTYKEYGNTDKELAQKVSNAWVNFARTGNPSTDYAQWTPYDLKNRNTMVIGNDNSMTMQKDYKGLQLKVLDEIKP